MGVDLSMDLCVEVRRCVGVYVRACDHQHQGGVDGTEGQEGGGKSETGGERVRNIKGFLKTKSKKAF